MATANLLQWYFKYDGILTFTLVDAEDVEVSGATVTVVVKDPEGTQLATGSASDNGDGTYSYNLAYNMAGVERGDILKVEATFVTDTIPAYHAYQEVSVEVVIDRV